MSFFQRIIRYKSPARTLRRAITGRTRGRCERLTGTENPLYHETSDYQLYTSNNTNN